MATLGELELTQDQMNSAWERVLENAGGPGVDGVTVERFAGQAASALPELLIQAKSGEYQPLPLRKIVVEKRNSKKGRQLLVPCVRDRVLQTAMARVLSRSFEEEFLEVSFAYRPGRGVDRAVARMLQLRERGWTYVVEADITAYFERIGHGLLEKQLAQDEQVSAEELALLKKWIHADAWDGYRLERVKRGLAMGSPISPLLANLFLTPLDRRLAKSEHKPIRYADDFVILCRSAEEAAAAMEETREVVGQLGLELNMTKTRVTSFEDGFRFVGVEFGSGTPMVPWKQAGRSGKVLFMARPMPAGLLRKYRREKQARGNGAGSGAAQKKNAGLVRRVPGTSGKVEVEVPFLYITEQGAILRKSGDRFLVEHDGGIVLDIPYHRLEHILIFGNVQLTTQAMAEALDHNIPVSLFTRQGRFRGALTPPPGHHVLLRLAQYAVRSKTETCVTLARETIRWKIENEIRVLERFADREAGPEGTREDIAKLAELQGSLDGAGSIAEAEGVEGSAARIYFGALMRFNRSGLVWTGREKHPARDPLNAMLSLAYSMLTHELTALVMAWGMDPAIGFLHEVDGARPSLALDLIEPFRAPVADRLVMTLVNRGQVGAEDFEKRDDHGGLFLKAGAMRGFFEEWEKWMLAPVERGAGGKGVSFRMLLRAEVEKLAGILQDGGVWVPWGFDQGFEGGVAGAEAAGTGGENAVAGQL